MTVQQPFAAQQVQPKSSRSAGNRARERKPTTAFFLGALFAFSVVCVFRSLPTTMSSRFLSLPTTTSSSEWGGAATSPAKFANSVTFRGRDRVCGGARNDDDSVRGSGGGGSAAAKQSYIPAAAEAYVLNHGVELGLDSLSDPSGCDLWREESSHSAPAATRAQFTKHLDDLKEYNARVAAFSLEGHNFTDLRQGLRYQSRSIVCGAVDLHLDKIFAETLSWVPGQGLVEPLLLPLRHPIMCPQNWQHLMDLTYLVHDFGALCRHITPHSRTILVDMGASLAFHGTETQPAVYLTELYRKFGIVFDHIYAYEVTPQDPAAVFGELVPLKLQSAYHWINTGVDAEPGAILNPWTMIKEHFNPDDLIVVKLDIDTSSIEVPLARQLLNDPQLQSLVDHFYFEHHVHLGELASNWGGSMEGTMYESLQLFSQLREKGVASHYWV